MYCVLCLSSIFPECRVKRQSNPCWLDHNHMWPALVWSLSIGSSFMSMSTAFKKLQASNCKVYKVRPFLTKNSPVCRVPAQHKKWVSVSGSKYQMYQMLEMSRHDLYSLSSEHLAPQPGASRASTASAETIKPFITIATNVAIGLNRWSSGIILIFGHMPYAWVSMSLETKVHTKVRNQEKAPTRDNWL